MRRKLSNLLFGLGILFLLIGVFFYLTFYGIIIGFACLTIGTILILISIKNWKFKLISIGLPLLFVAISLYMSFTAPETYLIPDGYRGSVYVIFNQRDGIPKEYEGRRRLYRIPSTGVLFTQFKDEQGFINQEYYYVTKEGQRKKLGVLDTRNFNEEWTLVKNSKEPPRDSLAVFNPGTMGTFGNSDDSGKMVFLYLSVGAYNDTLRKSDFSYEYIDSLRKEYKKN